MIGSFRQFNIFETGIFQTETFNVVIVNIPCCIHQIENALAFAAKCSSDRAALRICSHCKIKQDLWQALAIELSILAISHARNVKDAKRNVNGRVCVIH